MIKKLTAVFIFSLIALSFVQIAKAQQSVTITFPSGLNCSDIPTCLGNIGSALASIAQYIFPVMIIIGGIIVMTSTGKPERYGKGVQTIAFGALGFLITLVASQAPGIIQAISQGNSPTIFKNIFNATAQTLQSLAEFIVPILVLIGGYQIMTSAGEPEKLEKGQKILTWALVGFFITLLVPIIYGSVVWLYLGQTGQSIAALFTQYLTPISDALFAVGIPAASIIILLGGYFVMASGDDPERRKRGGQFIGFGALGLLIVLIFNGIIGAVKELSTGALTNTSGQIVTAILGIFTSIDGIAVYAAAVVLLVGAYFVMSSGDNAERRASGWKYISWGAVGLLLTTLIGFIIALVQSVAGVSGSQGIGQLLYNNLKPIWNTIATAMIIAGIPAVTIVFIIGGYFYMISGDDVEKRNKGRKYIMWGVIGIILIVMSNTFAWTITYLTPSSASQIPQIQTQTNQQQTCPGWYPGSNAPQYPPCD